MTCYLLPMRVTPLEPTQGPALERLLTGPAHLFPRGVLHTAGLEYREAVAWRGAHRGSRLTAALMQLGPTAQGWTVAVPIGAPDGCEALGAAARGRGVARYVLGERAAVDALWRGLGDPPTSLWSAHRAYLCTAPRPGPRLALRRGGAREVAALARMAAAMESEDLGQTPEDPAVLTDDVRRKVREGRIWVGEVSGQRVFKVDVGLSYEAGALVGGTFVPPEHRGRGYAAAGMRALAEILLREVPCVALHVSEANLPAVRSYVAAGFAPDAAFRLALPADPLHWGGEDL